GEGGAGGDGAGSSGRRGIASERLAEVIAIGEARRLDASRGQGPGSSGSRGRGGRKEGPGAHH
ncbi:MAG: hypothetical protein ACRDZQ_14900, partial [Acidimicrobiales bacterium]